MLISRGYDEERIEVWFTVVQTIHLFLVGSNVLKVIILIHVLVETFLEDFQSQ